MFKYDLIRLAQITFCTNDPSTHPFISEEERQYLTKEINGAERNTKRSSIPFKAILTSPAVLTLIIGGVSFIEDRNQKHIPHNFPLICLLSGDERFCVLCRVH